MLLDGRVAFITGAGAGIGKAAALLLAHEGADIAVVDRDQARVGKVVGEIKKLGRKAIPVAIDVSQPAEVQDAVQQTVKELGRIDIVFANAGVNGVWAPLEELEPEEWDRVMDINLKGTFLSVKYAVPELKKHGGSVIVTSSINGTRVFSNTGATAYACTKAGQVAFTKMVALELAKHKIRVNVICPGAIETEIQESTEKRKIEKEKPKVEYPEGTIPLTEGEPGMADQVAQLVLFLASDASSHVTGTEVWIDGGQSLLIG